MIKKGEISNTPKTAKIVEMVETYKTFRISKMVNYCENARKYAKKKISFVEPEVEIFRILRSSCRSSVQASEVFQYIRKSSGHTSEVYFRIY